MTTSARTADHAIAPLFLERWSPRAFTGEAIAPEDLAIIFEAARWAPSSYNSQPWRFIYARRDTHQWPTLFGLLNPFNQSWAERSAVLIVIASAKTILPPGATAAVPASSHSFDAGAAWALLALQASLSGWAAHAMAGFDASRAAQVLGIPDYYVDVAVAIGRPGDKSVLPLALQDREQPSPRNPQASFVFEGRYKSA
jgi:nitroreductase